MWFAGAAVDYLEVADGFGECGQVEVDGWGVGDYDFGLADVACSYEVFEFGASCRVGQRVLGCVVDIRMAR